MKLWSYLTATLLALGLALAAGDTTALRAQDSGDDSAAPAAADASEPGSDVDVKALHGMKGQFWVLDFKPLHLRMIGSPHGPAVRPLDAPRPAAAAKEKGSGKKAPEAGREKTKRGGGRVYWYLVYTVANRTENDLDVFLSLSARSDGKKTYSDLYLPRVEKSIEKRERRPLWGKTDEFEILAKRDPKDPKYHYVTLKAGQSRKCVAVFNAIDPNASKITIRVAGLTNEVIRKAKDDGSMELVERVREYYYVRPGDEYAVNLDSFKAVGDAWVDRRLSLQPPRPVTEK